MERVQYQVSGLVNSQSRTKLKNSLDKMEGVQKIAVDLGRSTVEVKFNQPANSELIKSCIERNGYSIQ